MPDLWGFIISWRPLGEILDMPNQEKIQVRGCVSGLGCAIIKTSKGGRAPGEGNKMNAKLKTRKEANGTYSWKVSTADYPGVWERTEAVTPWGARAQGMPYLRLLAEGEEIRKRLEEKAKAHHEKYGRYTEDFAPTWMN